MKKKLFLYCTIALLWSIFSFASYARVDMLQVRSEAMDKNVPVVAVLPDNYETTVLKKYPVVYLLHGYGNMPDQWITVTKPNLEELATRLQMIFVCPHGNNSWYWDSPVDPTFRYETFVSKELIHDIDHRYRTIDNRNGRAVTGYSMGGHGALWLAINHQDVFGAAGSMSGGVDIRPFPDNWEMKARLGEYAENKARWDAYTVINKLDALQSGSLALIIDCGYDDFFLQVNRNLHDEMLKRKIDHDFILRPGAHTHEYWNNSIDFQLLFFSKFFNKNKK